MEGAVDAFADGVVGGGKFELAMGLGGVTCRDAPSVEESDGDWGRVYDQLEK